MNEENRKNISELLYVIGTCKDILGLEEREVEFLKSIEDPACTAEYLKCLASGISYAVMEEMRKKNFTVRQIVDEKIRILTSRFRDKDKLYTDIQAVKAEAEKKTRDVDEEILRHEKKFMAFMEQQRKDLEEVIAGRDREIRSKDDLIKRLDENILALKKQVQDLGDKLADAERRAELTGLPEESEDALQDPETRDRKEGIFRIFGRPKIKDEEARVRARAERRADEIIARKEQEADDYQRFIQNVMLNEAYSEEQKRFLQQCYKKGDTYLDIRKYAYPKLPVEFMEAIRARQMKK